MRVLVRIFTTRSVIPDLPECQAGIRRIHPPQQRREVLQLFVAGVRVIGPSQLLVQVSSVPVPCSVRAATGSGSPA